MYPVAVVMATIPTDSPARMAYERAKQRNVKAAWQCRTPRPSSGGRVIYTLIERRRWIVNISAYKKLQPKKIYVKQPRILDNFSTWKIYSQLVSMLKLSQNSLNNPHSKNTHKNHKKLFWGSGEGKFL